LQPGAKRLESICGCGTSFISPELLAEVLGLSGDFGVDQTGDEAIQRNYWLPELVAFIYLE
jgi:hypothetical protein